MVYPSKDHGSYATADDTNHANRPINIPKQQKKQKKKMEHADGFIRTLPESSEQPIDQVDSEPDSESSALQFASDGEGRKSPRAFFETSAPAAWDFKSAREKARTPQPFQTTIDAKIRTAREKNLTSQPPTETTDQNDANEPENISSDDEEERQEHEQEQEQEDQSHENPTTRPKGKKRMRKERVNPSTFLDLHLSKPLQKAVQSLEWVSPTPVQSSAIPYILAGRDICASAVTGSGKTAAFLLPVLERLLQAGIDNATRVLILLPTRELAAQCHAVLTTLAKYTNVRAALTVGGLCTDSQQVALRTRPHVIVATPGRLIDHVRNSRGFSLDDIEVLVLDEADRLLDMGFQAEVEEIVRNTPAQKRQTLLFSATMTPGLKGLIKLSLQNPITLAVDPVYDVAATLQQEFVKLKPMFQDSKEALLLSLVTRTYQKRTIVFFRQKVTAHRMKIIFGLAKLSCGELHGNLTQAQRLAALDAFRDAHVDVLLCTDLAARGLDIVGVDTVVNFDMPTDVKEYVHRVGRTARAGRAGRACSLVCTGVNDERRVLKAVAKRASGKLVARVVPASVVGKWKAWVDGVQAAVKAVLKEEQQERELRMAEMEVNKVKNIAKYSEDIYSRPAKTWFQSEQEKKADKGRTKEEEDLSAGKNNNDKGTSRKRKAEEMETRRKEREKAAREGDYSKQRADARIQKRKRGGRTKR